MASAVKQALGIPVRALIRGREGIAEIALAVLVAASPRYGGWAAAVWLGAGAADLVLAGRDGLALCCALLSAGALAPPELTRDFFRGGCDTA